MFAPRVCGCILILLSSVSELLIGQSSTALLAGGQSARYQQFKQTFQAMPPYNSALSRPSGGSPYDLDNCEYGSAFLNSGRALDEIAARQADLALQVVIWTNDLRSLGFPQPVFQPLLASFEDSELALIQEVGASRTDATFDRVGKTYDVFRQRLAAVLNAYRSRYQRLNPVIVEGGCGADEISIHIRTQPPGANVDIIPRFFYKLCQVQKMDADDPVRCDHWRDVGRSDVQEVSGSYFYRVRWSDGSVERGVLDFSKAGEDSTVTLTRRR